MDYCLRESRTSPAHGVPQPSTTLGQDWTLPFCQGRTVNRPSSDSSSPPSSPAYCRQSPHPEYEAPIPFTSEAKHCSSGVIEGQQLPGSAPLVRPEY